MRCAGLVSLIVQNDRFLLNGEPFRILSGSIHYFRVLPALWGDRLRALKACGLNTVETYIAWNVHEPRKGQFTFDGMADIEAFIQRAHALGLHVIIRPGPYICAEWDFGGLPAWLLAEQGIRLRCYNEPFLRFVDAFYDVLLPKLRPYLSTHGGPIIAMQIENEYGSFGNDRRYLDYMKSALITRGVDVLLFTSDGPEDHMLQGGMVDGTLATVNFGSNAAAAFAKLKEYQSGRPLMCTEFWNGWFDHWGESHHTRDAKDVAQELRNILQAGASVNLYMFHGGTNFGFFNGANHQDKYAPTVTSYDYDALLDETGTPTDKFFAVRAVLEDYVDLPALQMPDPPRRMKYGALLLGEHASLFKNLERLSVPVQRTWPESMEKLGQSYGFILYTTRVSGPRRLSTLFLDDLHDRAMAYQDGEYRGGVERGSQNGGIQLEIPAGGSELMILVENMGRINYGPLLHDEKGMIGGARLGGQILFNWTIRPLSLEDPGKLVSWSQDGQTDSGSPCFYRGFLHIEETGDTFMDMSAWQKGVVYVNGFNIGRYWSAGPYRTLYVPSPLLRKGRNEIVVFELYGSPNAVITFTDEHKFVNDSY